jgi:hypothetical protein
MILLAYLLILKDLEEIKKYSSLVSSSLIVVKLISVERKEDGFSLPLLTACTLFRLQLPFECIYFFEKETKCKSLLSGSSFGSKVSLVVFLLLKFGNRSAIGSVVVVLVTIVTSHLVCRSILRRLAYTNGNRNAFLIIYW